MLFGAFNAQRGATKSVTTSGTSQNVAISPGTESVRITNVGTTNSAFVRPFSLKYEAGTACTSSDTVVLPSSSLVLYKEKDQDTIAVLQLTGATTLYIQPGGGGV
jgi:hypothetical protein